MLVIQDDEVWARYIDQASFLLEKGYFVNISVNKLAEMLYKLDKKKEVLTKKQA
jgi:hypothetical protein